MPNLDKNLIKEKLKRILNYLEEMKPILEVPYKVISIKLYVKL